MTAREILVPFGYRALTETRPDDLEAQLRADAEAVATDAGLDLPASRPTIVDTWPDAAALSPWCAERVATLSADDRDALAFAYWTWDDEEEDTDG